MAPELKRKLEYSDLLSSPDDGRRYELIRGDLCVTPSPSPAHQRISKRLMLLLVAYFEGAPLLVVEILSPSTRKQDRGLKARRYAELGVEHYWIVDPEAKRLECH